MFSFISIEFGLSFIAFFCLYWLLGSKPKLQNLLLLCTSYLIVYLCGKIQALIALLLFTVFIYAISVRIVHAAKPRIWLITAIICTILNLALWKYFDFFRTSVSYGLDSLKLSSDWLSGIILPLGLSYYSFQAISYLVSLYQERCHNQPAGKVFTLPGLALHLAFFPTITAGPIARAYDARGLTDIYNQPCGMATQIYTPQRRRILAPTLALCLIVMALMKNWWLSGWIADNWVDPVFANPMQYHSLEILAAIYGYTVQLFFNFSGYSDLMIAIGLLLGFRLPVNFRAPLLAHNIREFWLRWHISLSTWIRDYIYIPLGGGRHRMARTQLNLLIAMALSGIWHGTGWHFLIWGLLHAAGMILLNLGDWMYSRLRHCELNKARDALSKSSRPAKIISIVVTVHFVCFCFIFFRAPTLNDALLLLHALFYNNINVPLSTNPFYFFSLLLLAWILYPFLAKFTNMLYKRADSLPRYRLILPLLLLVVLVLICAPTGIPGFIYANF
ncbi:MULTISPECIES: MBOAT family protein [unclassified Snodgrassella]|uniref:MBOAT family O-acyltransferase n=1 Tax=unclassified Snodgrassella TaxID=2625236 RepID=UPI0018DDE921|nr:MULTISPECIES: MBOAT family protein [unclassified Snodgrassella]MBI0158844.1 MBOAT family protein [Snodgrassella sp. W6238H11]MBI0160569.1 MBOAT family protein [Snodgrassella sp. W6238H14]